MVQNDVALYPAARNIHDDFYIVEADAHKYLTARGAKNFKIRIKKDGYVPKGGLYLVRYLAKEDITGSCLDIGTGETGVIAQFIKLFGAKEVTACDIDDAALAHARRSSLYASQIEWIHSDVYNDIPDDRQFDTIVSNPPQLPSLNVESAHDYGGTDGLVVIQRILSDGKRHLKPNGRILLLVFDFLYDHKNKDTGRSLECIGTDLGYESKIVASYERDVKPSGKTFENLEYIEATFPSFRFKRDKLRRICHNFHIVEFKLLVLLLTNSLCFSTVGNLCEQA